MAVTVTGRLTVNSKEILELSTLPNQDGGLAAEQGSIALVKDSNDLDKGKLFIKIGAGDLDWASAGPDDIAGWGFDGNDIAAGAKLGSTNDIDFTIVRNDIARIELNEFNLNVKSNDGSTNLIEVNDVNSRFLTDIETVSDLKVGSAFSAKDVVVIVNNPLTVGKEASIGSLGMYSNAGVGELYVKKGAANTAWELVQTGIDTAGWGLTGNALTQNGVMGSTTNFDVDIQRNSISKMLLTENTTALNSVSETEINSDTQVQLNVAGAFKMTVQSLITHITNATVRIHDGVNNRFFMDATKTDLGHAASLTNISGSNVELVAETTANVTAKQVTVEATDFTLNLKSDGDLGQFVAGIEKFRLSSNGTTVFGDVQQISTATGVVSSSTTNNKIFESILHFESQTSDDVDLVATSLLIRDDSRSMFKVKCIAMDSNNTLGATYERTVDVKKIGTANAVIGKIQTDYTSEDDNKFNISFNTNGANLEIKVKGLIATNVDWVIVVEKTSNKN